MRREIAVIAWLMAASALAGCGGRGPVPALHEGLHTASAQLTIADAVEQEGGYGAGRVEVLVSRTQLRMLIDDARLAEADSTARAAAAARAVATAEKVLAADPEFPAIEAISVAIVHPANLRRDAHLSHTEEVFGFRRAADARFAPASD